MLYSLFMEQSQLLLPFSSFCRRANNSYMFHSACSSSILSQTLYWQRQTSKLICWKPPLLSYPTGMLKQDRKAYFSLPPRFFFIVLSALLPWTALQWFRTLTHAPSSCSCLSLCASVCVSSYNVQGVTLLQYVQYHTTGLRNPDNNSNDAERRSEMAGC